MMTLVIEDTNFFDEKKECFIPVKGATLALEHSLVSISKWEAKWQKPFLSHTARTREESIDYIRCMNRTQNVNPVLYTLITDAQIIQVNEYINNPMTATTFAKVEGKGHNFGKVTTSEEIYYALAANQIPFECEKWHFNRLMTLLRICEEKNKPKKKMRKGDIARQRRSLNAARRARAGTRG